MEMHLRILILSFYYCPDLSAGSFRTSALVKALSEKMPKDLFIDVLTTLPNRYKSFSSEAPELEKYERIKIRRIKLPTHKSGMIDQSKAFLCFAKEVLHIVRDENYDLVFATSSRLMTAALGAYIARIKKARLYLDIRDIFVDTINDVLPRGAAALLKPIFSIIENWTFKKADKVNLVSEGFKPYFLSRYPFLQYSTITNGIDEEFIAASRSMKPVSSGERKIIVLYAGNIGEGQGLHAIIPELAKEMHEHVIFRVVGDGGRKTALESAVENSGIDNVELLLPIKRKHLIDAYREADVLFLHLNNYDAFKKVLPSKLFEYAAMGKPVWAGVSGYAADFVNTEISNSAVFEPCNVQEAKKSFITLLLTDEPRTEFVDKFSRPKLMQVMSDDVLSLLPENFRESNTPEL